MQIETSDGDILDKISILELKQEFIKDQDKLKNVNKELEILKNSCEHLIYNESIADMYRQLKQINRELWIVENSIRGKEKSKHFDSEFIELARSVYFTNDRRADIKKQINIRLKSGIIEEKNYQEYTEK